MNSQKPNLLFHGQDEGLFSVSERVSSSAGTVEVGVHTAPSGSGNGAHNRNRAAKTSNNSRQRNNRRSSKFKSVNENNNAQEEFVEMLNAKNLSQAAPASPIYIQSSPRNDEDDRSPSPQYHNSISYIPKPFHGKPSGALLPIPIQSINNKSIAFTSEDRDTFIDQVNLNAGAFRNISTFNANNYDRDEGSQEIKDNKQQHKNNDNSNNNNINNNNNRWVLNERSVSVQVHERNKSVHTNGSNRQPPRSLLQSAGSLSSRLLSFGSRPVLGSTAPNPQQGGNIPEPLQVEDLR